MCQAVKEAGMRCGVSVKPGTDIDLLIPLIEADLVDLILVFIHIMVHPTFVNDDYR